MTKTLYLCQHGSETRIEMEAENYERLIDSKRAAIIDRHGHTPVVKLS